MNYLMLRGACHTEITEVNTNCLDVEQCWSSFGKSIAEHVHALTSRHSYTSQNTSHFICSTINGASFSSGLINWETCLNHYQKQMPIPPFSYIDAYECASWGYVLRHFLHHNPQQRYVMFSILDVNVFDYNFWKSHSQWGHSGFGVTTVLIDCDSYSNSSQNTPVSVGRTPGRNTLLEFGFQIRKATKTLENVTVVRPFFPEHMNMVLTNILQNQPSLDNLHEQFGHVFGQDPWLSLIDYGNKGLLDTHSAYLVCSSALNSYFALAQLYVADDVLFKITREKDVA